MTNRHSIAPLPYPDEEISCTDEKCKYIARLNCANDEDGIQAAYYSCESPWRHNFRVLRYFKCARCGERCEDHIRFASTTRGEYLLCPDTVKTGSFKIGELAYVQ